MTDYPVKEKSIIIKVPSTRQFFVLAISGVGLFMVALLDIYAFATLIVGFFAGLFFYHKKADLIKKVLEIQRKKNPRVLELEEKVAELEKRLAEKGGKK